MSVPFVRLVVELAALLTLGLGLVAGARAGAARLGLGAPFAWLRLGRAALVAAALLPVCVRAGLGPDRLFPAPVEVWAKAGADGPRVSLALTALRSPAPGAPSGARPAPLLAAPAVGALAAALVGASALGLARLLRDRRRLRGLCGRAVPIRRLGRISILVSDEVAVPFSARLDCRALVVLPEAFVLEPAHLRIALAHELSHVRAGDTGWAHVTALARALLPWHPLLPAWGRWLARLEELACDARVCGRRGVSAQSYGETLLWAAERARPFRPLPAATVPMLDRSPTFLERRLRMVLSPARRSSAPLVAAGLAGAGCLAALALCAALAYGAISDRRVDAARLRAVAGDLATATGFRVPVDEAVVDAANRVVSDSEARARFREGLARLASYRAIGLPALERRGIPPVLLAVPQVESRVQPLPPGTNPTKAAGIWQFIPSTARRYGLRVDATADERLEPRREVEAAAAHLADLHARFGDWSLAIAAYNEGEKKVAAAVARTGARDAAALLAAGGINRYTSTVLAAMLLAQEPALVE